MPISKQRKNQKKKSVARTNSLKAQAKILTKNFLENYRRIMESKNQSELPKTEE